MKILKLSDITTDAGTQIRVKLNEAAVEDYKEAYEAKADMPPVDVFVVTEGKQTRRILADGFHRIAGAGLCGLTELNCTLHKGTMEDAIKFALGANTKHGLRRSNEDKRNAVEIALKSFSAMSDRALAEICGVSHALVGNLRPPEQAKEEKPAEPDAETTGEEPSQPPSESKAPASTPPPPRKRTGRDGKSRALPSPKRIDKTGFLIPVEVLPLWDEAEEMKAQIAQLRMLRGVLKMLEEKGTLLIEVNIPEVRAHLEQASADWERGIPHAVCPSCQGKTAKKNCQECKGRGFVSEFYWKTVVAQEVRDLREKVSAEAK